MSVPGQNPHRSPVGDVSLTLRPGSIVAYIPPLDARVAEIPFGQQLVARVRGEFQEMPGLSLTLAQAARLFALNPTDCQQVLGLLLSDGFLRCGVDEQYRLSARR